MKWLTAAQLWKSISHAWSLLFTSISASPTNETRRPHLVITVHGIRTHGAWQEELERLLPSGYDVVHYKYGYFSAVAFVFPLTRWIVTRSFRKALCVCIADRPSERLSIIAHSFGTHLVANGLLGIPKRTRPAVHNLILAGSVLKPGFSWGSLIGQNGVHRIINDCGTKDTILLLNQLCVPFMGMAGRVGFAGILDRRQLVNRWFAFGHSGYFEDVDQPNSFMERWWVPLLTSDAPPEAHDERKSLTSLGGLGMFLANNCEPIKLALYIAPIVLGVSYVSSLFRRLDEQDLQVHEAVSKSAIANAATERERARTLLEA
jgi:hypothetical protein